MANETHYHEFLKLINVDPSDITSHILERYQDFIEFYSHQNNLNIEQAFQKWCSIKILEPPSASIKELISPIKSANLVWGPDFGFTEIIETLQTSSPPTPPRLPALPPPPAAPMSTSSPIHNTPPPPPPPQSPPHTAKHIGYKNMENLKKEHKLKIKRNKTVGRQSRMETLSKLANNTTLFQKTLYLLAKDKKEVRKTLPILTTENNDLQCMDENDFKIYEYITKERKISLENIQKEKEKLVSLMHVEEKLSCSGETSNENM